jgi:8-oxo-dGTP diphosphatase
MDDATGPDPLGPAPAAPGRSAAEPASGRRRQRVTVYGICQDGTGADARILLTRAAPYLTVAGRWFLPGGGIDHGEEPVQALVREFVEETGLTVEVGELRGVLSDVIELPDGTLLHTVRIIHAVPSFRGQLRDEVSGSTDAARWFPLATVFDQPLMPYVRRALTELR